MEKETRYDLIERYLDDSVSQSEGQKVELLLATDAEFRAELELHRSMHLHLGDPTELRLRAALDNILQAPLPDNPRPLAPPSAQPINSGWLRTAGLVALLVLAGFAAWFWWGNEAPPPTQPSPAQQPVQVPSTEPMVENSPAPIQNPPKQDSPSRPIAMANPADFVPNPALEARMGSIRGDGAVLTLYSPPPGAVFLQKSGRVTLPIQGTLSADSMAVRQPFRLFVYSNRPMDWDSKQALFDRPVSFELAGGEQYRVDFNQQLRLRPGLYYVVVGQERLPEDGGGYRTIWVGKFSVQP